MTKLPLFDEIAAARERAVQGQRATVDLQLVISAMNTLGMLKNRLAPAAALPGDDQLDGIASRWPALTRIRDADAPKNARSAERIAARRLVLGFAKDHLGPIAAEAEPASLEMERLQNEQRQILEQPEWRAAVDELRAIDHDRRHAQGELEPIQKRANAIVPVASVLETFRDHLLSALAGARVAPHVDPNGVRAYTAAATAAAFLQSLGSLEVQASITLGLPEPIALPKGPSTTARDGLVVEVDRVTRAVADIAAHWRADADAISAELAVRQARYDAFTAALVARMG